ncbi:MAG TPA: hypothetical protein GXX63_07010 [Tissierellia bacterium]|nr:hypothetical protein [Tissierellia bacterium]
MSKYLTYYIKNLEDIKLSKTIAQIDSEESLDYITGSSIRGVYIYRYMNKYNIRNINEGVHKDKLLKGRIKFLNAYPVYKDERSIPFPKCYFCPKEKIKEFEYIDKLDLSVGLDVKLGEGFEKARFSEFVYLNKDGYKKVDVEKVSNLHINKRGNKNKLFRYDAIKSGQVFKGIIKVEDEEYIEEIKDLLDEKVVYIGGSKGSGYGKSLIYGMEVVGENPEIRQFKTNYDFDKHIYLIAMSDIIYRTELGEYKTFIDEEFIEKSLELESVEYIDSSIQTNNVTSFNNKWNCYLPQITAIKAGSIFKYRITGELNKKLVKDFIDEGIGERKIDGFGRFMIIDSLDDTLYYNADQESEVEGYDIDSIIKKLNIDQKNQIEDILTKIYEYKVNSAISIRVLKMYEKIENPNAMKNNQWGKLLEFFILLQYMEIESGKKKYKKYKEHEEEKRSRSFKQLKKVKYSGMDFMDFLNDYMEKSDDIEKFRNKMGIEKIDICNISSRDSKEFVFKTNMKVMAELCRYHLRKEDF